ncbi:MAG: NAD(P)H-dependent glycerol-3-phosphate dehydrogenase [Burkholderiaceae bacterium]
MNISILGAGAWGTALALNLAPRAAVALWGRDAAAMEAMAASRENRAYLPGFPLPANLRIEPDFDAAVAHAGDDGLLILASSTAGLRELAVRLQHRRVRHLIWLCKGFENGTRLLPHQVVRSVLGGDVAAGALSGPSFAQEVARGLPCALSVATADSALAERVVAAVHGANIRVYSTDDMVGVEVGGAVKNILAIAAGVADGLGLGLNARAALITRGLAEICRFSVALGGRPETCMGLSGVGDLILTCTGDLSRNRRVGLGLAAGRSLDQIVRELGHVAEGVLCAETVRALAAERRVEMPIADAVAAVLFDGETPQRLVQRLLARDPRAETF